MTQISWEILKEYLCKRCTNSDVAKIVFLRDEGCRNSIKVVMEDVVRANELEVIG